MNKDRNGPSRWRPLVPRSPNRGHWSQPERYPAVRARSWAERWALRGRRKAEADERKREAVASTEHALPSGYSQDLSYDERQERAESKRDSARSDRERSAK